MRAPLFAASLLALLATLGACDGGGPAPPPGTVNGPSPTTAPGPPAATPSPTAESPTRTPTSVPTAAPSARPVTSTPTAPPATPTPTPASPDLATADEAYREGDYPAAADAYARVAAASTGRERLEALLGQARAEIAAGEGERALATLAVLLAGDAEPETALAALYLRARAEMAAGDHEAAAGDYVAYADAGGPAALYAREDAAAAFALAGHERAARRQLELLIEASPASRQLRLALLALGQSYERSRRWSDAATTFERLGREAGSDTERALVLLHLGQIAYAQGDLVGWEAHLTEAIGRYPDTASAAEALEELVEGGREPDPVLAGTVYYKSFQDEEAIATLEAYLEDAPPGPEAAQAAYYRATALERSGRLREAVAGYDRAFEYAPAGAFAHKALWWAAFNADLLGDSAGAIRRYREIQARFPDSTFAAEAGFRIALAHYRAGEMLQAAEQCLAESQVRAGEARARALLWRGRALAALGDGAGARSAWQLAVEEPDGAYYSLRAELLLEGTDDEPLPGSWRAEEPRQVPEPDWRSIERWLATWAGTPAGSPDPTIDAAWSRALALRDLGEERRASQELQDLLGMYDTQPWPLLRLVRGFHRERIVHLAAMGAARLYLQAPASLQGSIPADLLYISYPLPHLDAALEVSERERVPVLLLYALVRQESFFDATAVSSAGALGLAQVMPGTGQWIADRLGVEFEPSVLLRPGVSLAFGAYYLGQQLQEFAGSPYFALAAYNAGPGNARRWSRDGTAADMDLYLEEIDIDEPKRYVRYVLQNYARYRWLYAGLDRPTLLPPE